MNRIDRILDLILSILFILSDSCWRSDFVPLCEILFSQLQRVQHAVQAGGGEQVGVGALFDDLAVCRTRMRWQWRWKSH